VTASPGGAAAGLLAGIGLLLLISWVGARRAPRLADRIGPFVGGLTTASRGRGPGDLPLLLLELMRSPSAPDPAQDRERAVVLQRAGRRGTPSEYRLERLTWSALGAGAGLALAVLLAVGGSSPLGLVLLSGCGAVAGWAACDASLRRQARVRQRTIEAQLPTLADLLALAVSAGASAVPALESTAATMTGPLGSEVARAVNGVRSGHSLDGELRAMADRIGLASVQRLVDALLVALERGTPLAEVLRAQAMDARAADRRRLMELAGRKDVLMLVPIVFLVLPSVVLVAVYPGVQALRIVVP
jgi:tight adherence protein C